MPEWRSGLGNFDEKELQAKLEGRGQKGDRGEQGLPGPGFNVSDPAVQTFTANVWFQPNTSRSCLLHVNATLTGLLNASGAVKIETSAHQNGQNPLSFEKVLIVLSVLLGMKDTLPVLVPAGHWVRIIPTGANLTLVCIRYDL
jgi:hypothetical protein